MMRLLVVMMLWASVAAGGGVAAGAMITSQPAPPAPLRATDKLPLGRVGDATAYSATVDQISSYTAADTTKTLTPALVVTPDLIAGSPWVDIRAKGGTLAAAVAVIGVTDKATVVFGSNQILSSGLIVPTNIELVPLNGATIKPNGYAFTYTSPSTTKWPLAQVFDMSGGGTVSIPNAPYVFPDYFQTNTTPGTTDMLSAINYAAAANPSVRLSEMSYNLSGTVVLSGNRASLSGSSLRSWLTKNGAFPAVSITGTRNVLKDLTIISTGGNGNVLDVAGAQYFDVNSVRVSGSGNGTTFPNTDICVGYDNTAYGKFRAMNVYNCSTGVSDLGGNNGAVTWSDFDIFTNDVNVDLAGPSNEFIGGTIAHANTTEIKVGTRYATSTVYPAFMRGHLTLAGTHLEGNNSATNPMIVVGNSSSTSIANDVPSFSMFGGFIGINSATRVPIQYNAGKSLLLSGITFNGAAAGNAGVIQTTTNYALRPEVQSSSVGSGAAIPWYNLFATAKGDLVLNSDLTNLFTIQATKPTIACTNTANSTLDTIRFFTTNASGNPTERFNIQTGVDTAAIKLTGNTSVVGTLGASSGGSTNHTVCWKSTGQLGYCSAVVAADGTCGTCN